MGILGLVLALAIGGCEDASTFARVTQLDSLAAAIGGPAAAAAPGDYILENDRIRVVIHARPDHTADTVAFGGTIIDADLQRPEPEFATGRGLDQLFELGPIIDLVVPLPSADNLEQSFTVVRPEANEDGGALLRVEGSTGNIVEAIVLLGAVLDWFDIGAEEPPLYFRTDYEIRPGEALVRITTTAYRTSISEEVEVVVMDGMEGTKSLLSILLGDLDRPCDSDADCTVEGETCESALALNVCRSEDSDATGAFGGWLALLGGKLSSFVSGAGFNPWANLEAAVAQDIDFFQNPVPFEFLAGIGDRVSYAIFSQEGNLMVPISSSNFTLAVSNEIHCPVKDLDCLKGRGFQMSAILAIGAGDVASAVAPYYAERGIATGRLEGVVVSSEGLEPISGAEVFVMTDPWPDASDVEVAAKSYEALVAMNKAMTTSVVRPVGDAGVVTQMETDVGTDVLLDGDYSGLVPTSDAGVRYLLVARKGALLSALHPVYIKAGETTVANVSLQTSGRMVFEVFDHKGVPIPAKATLGQCLIECALDSDCGPERVCDVVDRRCIPEDGCDSHGDCDPDEQCDLASRTCVCSRSGYVPEELGGHWVVDGVAHAHYTGIHGKDITLPPGTYEVVFSRGLEYSIDRQFFTVYPGAETQVVGHVNRVVDTSGFVSADFHVHGGNSPDSGVMLDDRVMSYVGEGVEFLSSSDHDVLTDYGPVIRSLGLEPLIHTQVGVESSPLMLTHTLGFPMAYDETAPNNMPEGVAFDWFGKAAPELMRDIRCAGALPPAESDESAAASESVDGEAATDEGPCPGDAVILMAHVFDYFNYYGLNSFDLGISPSFFMQAADPLFAPVNFSGAMDGFEIINGKTLDLIRRLTVAEVRDYNQGLNELIAGFQSGELTFQTFSAAHVRLGREIVGAALERTPEEQDAFIDASGGVDCGCLADDDCEAFTAPDEAPCDGFRGVVDDWMRMLNRGVVRTAVANSDSHGLYHVEAGIPRNFVRSSAEQPVHIDTLELNRNVRDGAVVASTGPFVRFAIDGAPVGGTVAVGEDGEVTLSVHVQSPLWFDVDRVEVYRNGRIIRVFEGCDRAAEGDDCIVFPNTGIDNLKVSWSDSPEVDSWYVVSALGTRGKDLAPVYSTIPLARFGFVETLDGLLGLLPIGVGGGGAAPPSVHPVLPYALTNPIWVEVDGEEGITPPEGEPPGWALQ
jgi:hypothetical protein